MTTLEPRRFLGVSPAMLPQFLRPWLRRFHVDFAPQTPPTLSSVLLATLVAIVGSLAVDAVLVQLGVAIFPSTRGYSHFQFADYSTLTVIGVLIACVGWPIVTRISSQPKWLFLRAALAVTIVLFAPDVGIWLLGQPLTAVFVLVWMHIGIALVTFLSLITLAPVRGATRMQFSATGENQASRAAPRVHRK